MWEVLVSSSPPIILLVLIVSAIFAFWPIFCLVLYLKGFKNYILGKMDSRVLCLLSFLIEFIIIIVLAFAMMYSGYLSSKLGYLTLIALLCLSSSMTKVRLLGFPCIYFSKEFRSYGYTIANIIFIICILSTLYFYEFTTPIKYTEFGVSRIFHIFYYLLNLAPYDNFRLFDIGIFIPIFIFNIFNLYFDIKEKREKKILFYDKLFFVPPILILIVTLIPSKIFVYPAPILYSVFYFLTFIFLIYTYDDIKYRSSNFNIALESYKKLIKNVANNFGKNRDYIINSIAKMLEKSDNNELREILFNLKWSQKEKMIIHDIAVRISKMQVEDICEQRRKTGECPILNGQVSVHPDCDKNHNTPNLRKDS
jgi:hypothetical protein